MGTHRRNLITYGLSTMLGLAVVAATAGRSPHAQAPDPNSAPNPYRMEADWVQLPAGRTMGAAIALEIDRDGKSVWVFDRCGGNDCGNSNLAPIMKFDPTGKLVTSFGAGMFNQPHGIGIDGEGNIYVSDERSKNGKGDVVVKFSPDGRVLMTLGKPGMPGDSPDMFHAPSDVAIAANGDIFVADGHGGNTNGRIVKFSKDGKFIKAWGKPGKAQGSSISRTASRSIRRVASSSAIAATAASRSSIRTETSSPNGSSSAGRAASTSVTTCCTWPTRNRTRPAIRASSAACASAASRTARSPPSFPSRQPNSEPAKASPPTIRATSFRATTASGRCGAL